MNRLRMCLLAVTIVGVPGASMAAPPSPRQIVPADLGWRFIQADPAGAEAPGFDDASWRRVDLPHDWSIESPPDPQGVTGNGEGYFPAGVGWYRRSLEVSPAWKQKRVSIEFDGVYRNAVVYLNGTKVGAWPSGYASVAFDLTPHLAHGGRNLLAVRVDNSEQPNSRWYSGSGIYRHVRLVVTEPMHVARWGVFVTTPEIAGSSARVTVQTKVSNESGCRHRRRGPDLDRRARTARRPAQAGSALTATPGASEVTQELTVAGPALWSPATPRLYKAVTRIVAAGKIVDEVVTPFGIRSIAWSVEKGFVAERHADRARRGQRAPRQRTARRRRVRPRRGAPGRAAEGGRVQRGPHGSQRAVARVPRRLRSARPARPRRAVRRVEDGEGQVRLRPRLRRVVEARGVDSMVLRDRNHPVDRALGHRQRDPGGLDAGRRPARPADRRLRARARRGRARSRRRSPGRPSARTRMPRLPRSTSPATTTASRRTTRRITSACRRA